MSGAEFIRLQLEALTAAGIEMRGDWERGNGCPTPIEEATPVGGAIALSDPRAVPKKSSLPLVLVETIWLPNVGMVWLLALLLISN